MLACSQFLLVFIIPDKFRVTKLLEVAIVFPKLEVVTLGLEACSFIQNAQVGSAVIRTETLDNLFQQGFLSFGKVLIVSQLVEVRY